MILSTFNAQGLGSLPKKADIRHFLDSVEPSVLFLQETMHSAEDAIYLVHNIRPRWRFCAIDSNGLSGGILVAWDPLEADLVPYSACAGIALIGKIRGFGQEVCILNLYRPCRDRQSFWEKVFASRLMEKKNLIICGDLNFTLSTCEVWGSGRREDLLGGFLKDRFEAAGLVDVFPCYLVPTWKNERSGAYGLAKRLDRFLIKQGMFDSCVKHRSWSVATGVSDHKAISLEFQLQAVFCRIP